MSDGYREEISPTAKITVATDEDGSVPVYLPDRTEVGRAKINLEDGTATIEIKADSKVAQLLQDNLSGISVMHFDRDAAEEVLNTEGETDDNATAPEEER